MPFRRARIALIPLLACVVPAAPSFADGGSPVVVELFTSQGCSSCPPADKIMRKLSDREDVIALALHVDYWDYIGWKDDFARPEYTERQRAYAIEAGRRSVYTPQMIVNGDTAVVGARAMEVADAIREAEQEPMPVRVSLTRDGDSVTIDAVADPGTPAMVVHAVSYTPHQQVEILHGENAGRTIDYANIVTDWTVVTEWDGQAPLRQTISAPADVPLAVLVQKDGQGPILGAARLR